MIKMKDMQIPYATDVTGFGLPGHAQVGVHQITQIKQF